MIERLRDRLEQLWVELQTDYEKRQHALYIAAFAFSVLSGAIGEQREKRRTRELAEAIADALTERRRR